MMFKEFREFALKGNMVDLAVGIIIGAAFGAIVSSLVDDIFMPVIGIIIGGIDFSTWFVPLADTKGIVYNTIDAAKEAGVPTLNIGLFINAVVKFVIVAFALFLVVKAMNALKRKEAEKQDIPAGPPADIALLTEIRDLLKK